MSDAKNQSSLTEGLAASLKSVTELTKTLLTEIQNNATSAAIINEKVETLTNEYKILSRIIRDGNGKASVITRLTVIENEIEDIHKDIAENKISDVVKIENDREFRHAKKIEKIKWFAAASPGVVLAIVKIIEYFIK